MKYRIIIKDAQGNPGYLTFPADNNTVRKMLGGQHAFPHKTRKVFDGDIVEDIPVLLIPRWKEKGWIEEVSDGSQG